MAIDIISILRSPISFIGEIDEELSKSFLKFNEKIDDYDQQYLIFHSRLKSYQKDYQEILTLREKLWATFGETHIFYRFYDKIAKTVHLINQAHTEYIARSKDKEAFPDNIKDNKDRLKELRKILFSLTGDTISSEINLLHEELILERKRNRQIKYNIAPMKTS